MNVLNWTELPGCATIHDDTSGTVWPDAKKVAINSTGILCRFTTKYGDQWIVSAPFSIQRSKQ